MLLNLNALNWNLVVRSASMRDAVLALALILALCKPINADVLYDTTAMTDAQTYTYHASAQSYIGGAANNSGGFRDEQVCDDFTLSAAHVIDSVTVDYLCLNATPPVTPAGGILVEVFSDSAGAPTEVPVAQYLAIGAAIQATTFSNTLGGTTYNPTGIRFTIDLTNANINLAAGTWWLSVVGVDETATGRRYYYISTAGTINGGQDRRRNGGLDHGTGYNGTAAGFDWALTTARELAMKVEGTPVIPCIGDVNGNLMVDIDDLVLVITHWGATGKDPADVTGNGIVDIDDLVQVITSWGACD